MADKDAVLARLMDVMADRMIDNVRASENEDVIKRNRVRALQLEKQMRAAKRARDHRKWSRLEEERRALEDEYLIACFSNAS